MEILTRSAEGFNLDFDRQTGVDSMKHVLVVDDDPSIRVMLTRVLQSRGFAVRTAKEGGDALEQIEQGCPDVVLLDLMMPGLDGWGFLDVVKQHCQRRGFKVPRVVVISAHLRMNPQELLKKGADALVTKPFDIEELFTLLRHLPDPVEVE